MRPILAYAGLLMRVLGKLVMIGIFALPLVTGCGEEAFETPGRVPVLVIGLDTVRADHLGCYGHPFVETPSLDALAAESVLFERCSSAATWTLPSFTSAFTGLYPYRHGVVGGDRTQLPEGRLRLGDLLSGAGYASRGFAAVQYFRDETGLGRGIDSLELYVSGPTSGRSLRYQDRIEDWIARAPHQTPWFLFVHYYDAHAPYEPPAPFDRRYYEGNPYDPAHRGLEMLNTSNNRAMVFRDITTMYTWMYGVTDPEFAPRQYAADVAALDRSIGSLIESLRSNGWLDRMLVVLMADHGEHLNEHSCWYTHAYPYEECLRVPLMIRLPGARQAGRRISDEVSLVDLLPTIGELLDLPVPGDLDGISLVPAIQGDALPHRVLQAEQGADEDRYVKALWDADWRFLSFRLPGRHWVELYDRRADRAETRDLAQSRPEMVRRFETELLRRFPEEAPLLDPGLEAISALPEDARQRLRSLGYIR